MGPELFELHAAIEKKHWWFVARRRIARAIVRELAPPGSGALVVDVGCGTGANIAGLAGEYRCIGSDTSAEAISHARSRFPAVRFVQGAAPGALGPAASDADVVMLMDVMEHVPDDFALLSSVLAPMKPGAHLLLTVPAHEKLWSRHDESFGHYRRYTTVRLAETWKGLPVSVRLLSYYNSRLYPLVRAVRVVGRLSGRAAGANDTDFAIPPAPLNTLLEGLFAGEADRLTRVLRRGGLGFPTGVSIVAVLRREPGPIMTRRRPPFVQPDLHTPAGAPASA